MFISAFFSRSIPIIKPELRSPLIDLHAILALFGIALFSIAFIFSILYLIQEKSVKSKKFGGFEKSCQVLKFLIE